MRNEQIKNIWMLTREYGELAGAGGVKDVVCQLSESLARWTGRSVNVVMPLYGFMDKEAIGCEPVLAAQDDGGPLQCDVPMHEPLQFIREKVVFYRVKINRVNIYLVDSQRFSAKSAVYTYTADDELATSWQKKSAGHHDYFAMNLLLQKAALELMILLGEQPDVIHCHDGHTAVVPALLRECPGYISYFRGTGCVVTVHNAGYGYHQEVADLPYAASICGLPPQVIDSNRLDEKFDPFLVASRYAILNTVSENYARELQETSADAMTGWLGHELLARNVTLEGVTNGISPEAFDLLAMIGERTECYFEPGDESDDLRGKKLFKEQFLAELEQFNIPREVTCHGVLQNYEKPLFTFIGRLGEQKGVDILLDVVSELVARDDRPQFLILGSGDTDLESRLEWLAENEMFSGRLCFLKGFHSQLASKVYAAGDFFVVPSRYEPCGLTDFIAQLHGNIPVVHHVGGLVKVLDGVTGIGYAGDQYTALLQALERALAVWENPEMKRNMQLQAVQTIQEKYTWRSVMKQYLALYRRAKL